MVPSLFILEVFGLVSINLVGLRIGSDDSTTRPPEPSLRSLHHIWVGQWKLHRLDLRTKIIHLTKNRSEEK
jgi:hypothetical protein